ncbi:hypothetical protein KZX45_13730 [Georgenia sp. EYE_87]|uniref:hypothetical protein n=1 Tax=Georgenia sp. EYE_87 TaxID=2853448 RepID=UPI002002FE13|nr:hypothetical protein [Georgenia sp. EYE_87]MCK6211606.1 hypothetical protein [Georgenia sp. EYE_87]
MVTETFPRTRRGMRTAGVVVGVLLRVAAVLLLGASVALGWQAAWSRFGVCFVGGDPPLAGLPEDSTLACYAVQDHLYDYDVPADPWVPIADAAQREGLSLMALGVGVGLVALSVAGRWYVRLLSVVGGANFAAAMVGTGVPVLRSGLAGEPVGFGDWLAASSLTFLTPLATPALAVLATPALAVLAWHRGGRDGRIVAVFWAAVTVAQPFPEFIISLFLWGSHDTSPLNGLLRCVAVAVAAVAVAVTLVPVERRSQIVPRPLRSIGRATVRALAAVAAKIEELDDRLSPNRR